MAAKTKYYYFGDMKFEAYSRAAGFGWECGVKYAGKVLFVGNFVHKSECTTWWKQMNRHMATFCKKYDYMEKASTTWHCKFFAHYLNKHYYTFLDKVFTGHNRTYNKFWNQDVKNYKKYSRFAA